MIVDCTIIIVAYRSGDDLPALIGSLHEAAGALSWHVVIVNNDRDDDLSEVAERPRVTLVTSEENRGYAGGLNLGLLHAPDSRFFAFLNPDLVLGPRSIETLVATAGTDPAGAAVPVICNTGNVIQPSLRREPTVLGSLGEAVFGDHWASRPPWLAELVRDRRQYSRPQSVDWATGAALVVRASVAREVGEWDADRFFLYSEETDYCRRIRAGGWTIAFAPDAVVRHRGAGSGSSTALNALLETNKVRYFRKWNGPLSSWAFVMVSLLHNTVRLRRPDARFALIALVSGRVRTELPGGAR